MSLTVSTAGDFEALLDLFRGLGGTVEVSASDVEHRTQIMKLLLKFFELYPLLAKYGIEKLELKDLVYPMLSFRLVLPMLRFRLIWPILLVSWFGTSSPRVQILPAYYVKVLEGEIPRLAREAVEEVAPAFSDVPVEVIEKLRSVLTQAVREGQAMPITTEPACFLEALDIFKRDRQQAARHVIGLAFVDFIPIVLPSQTFATAVESLRDRYSGDLYRRIREFASTIGTVMYRKVIEALLEKCLRGELPELVEVMQTLYRYGIVV